MCLQGSTDVTRQSVSQAGVSSQSLPPDAAEVAIDTMPGTATATQHQALVSALQHTPMTAAVAGKPDGNEGNGISEAGSSSYNADSPCPHATHALAANRSYTAAMTGTTVGTLSAAFGGEAVSSDSKPAASLTVAEWSPSTLDPSSSAPAAPTYAPPCRSLSLYTAPLTTPASVLGIIPLDIHPYTTVDNDHALSSRIPSLSSSMLALPERKDSCVATAAAAAGMAGSSCTMHADFSRDCNSVPKVPQLSPSTLHMQPTACSTPAASLQDSPRPGLQQPLCTQHPPTAAAPTLSMPCWAAGEPWPDSPRPAPQPSLPLPLSLQDAALLTRPAAGLASPPGYTTLPDCPRLSLPQSMRAVFQSTSAPDASLSESAAAAAASWRVGVSMPPSKEGPTTIHPPVVPSLPVDHVGAALPSHPFLPAGEAVPVRHDPSVLLHSSSMLASTMLSESPTNARDTSTSLNFTLPASWPGQHSSADPRADPAEMADPGGQVVLEPSVRNAPHPRVQLDSFQAKKPLVIDLTNDESDHDQGRMGDSR